MDNNLDHLESAEPITVEVVYATADLQRVWAVSIATGATAEEAVRATDVATVFPEVDLEHLMLGIYGNRIETDQVLKSGDRVEIYRPLSTDPREARRRLAAAGSTMGSGDDSG